MATIGAMQVPCPLCDETLRVEARPSAQQDMACNEFRVQLTLSESAVAHLRGHVPAGAHDHPDGFEEERP